MFRHSLFAAITVAIVDLLCTSGVLTTHRTLMLTATTFAVTVIVAFVSCGRVTEEKDTKMAVDMSVFMQGMNAKNADAVAKELSHYLGEKVKTGQQARELVEHCQSMFHTSESKCTDVNMLLAHLKYQNNELEVQVSSLRQQLPQPVEISTVPTLAMEMNRDFARV
jgi:hypothetical protein